MLHRTREHREYAKEELRRRQEKIRKDRQELADSLEERAKSALHDPSRMMLWMWTDDALKKEQDQPDVPDADPSAEEKNGVDKFPSSDVKSMEVKESGKGADAAGGPHGGARKLNAASDQSLLQFRMRWVRLTEWIEHTIYYHPTLTQLTSQECQRSFTFPEETYSHVHVTSDWLVLFDVNGGLHVVRREEEIARPLGLQLRCPDAVDDMAVLFEDDRPTCVFAIDTETRELYCFKIADGVLDMRHGRTRIDVTGDVTCMTMTESMHWLIVGTSCGEILFFDLTVRNGLTPHRVPVGGNINRSDKVAVRALSTVPQDQWDEFQAAQQQAQRRKKIDAAASDANLMDAVGEAPDSDGLDDINGAQDDAKKEKEQKKQEEKKQKEEKKQHPLLSRGDLSSASRISDVPPAAMGHHHKLSSLSLNAAVHGPGIAGDSRPPRVIASVEDKRDHRKPKNNIQVCTYDKGWRVDPWQKNHRHPMIHLEKPDIDVKQPNAMDVYAWSGSSTHTMRRYSLLKKQVSLCDCDWALVAADAVLSALSDAYTLSKAQEVGSLHGMVRLLVHCLCCFISQVWCAMLGPFTSWR